jgi:hypothetical protein
VAQNNSGNGYDFLMEEGGHERDNFAASKL